MNYIILKGIIESTIANFKCKDCNSWITEWNINILGSAGNSVNLEVICPNCKTQWVVKAEIGLINNAVTPETLMNLKNTIAWIQNTKQSWIDAIKDTDILDIRENLKNCSSIEDLFKV